MILLDTNVVSELMRPEPDPVVFAWLAAQPASQVFLSVIAEAELRYGAAILPPGRRRDRLRAQIEDMLQTDFGDRILPFDRNAARAYAAIGAIRRSSGDPIGNAECQMAAIARCAGASIATRNVKHFRNCGVPIINPWAA